ncbi:MAG: ATP-binding protein, partial [Polyangiaceae bacterium]
VSEERLRRVVEASGVAIWETDGGREILVDTRFCALFGLRTATAHMLEDVFAHVAPEDRAHVARSFRNAKAGPPGTVFVAHLRVVDDHGVPLRYVEWRGGVDADAEGKSRFAGTVIDVSARREVELERERFHADATRARQRLQMQFAQAPVAVSIVSGPDSLFEMANHLYLQMTGRQGDAVGRAFKDVFAELPPDAPIFAMLEEVKRSGTPFEAEEYLVPLDRKGNGQLEDVYFKLTCQPIRDDDGKVVDIMTVAVDVTSQVQARRRIEGLLQELKLADQRKDEFLATLAHELRNPMAAISSALSLLEEVGDHHEDAEKYRETARRQMGTLVRLVDDLLDVARITRGKVGLRKEPVDFAAVVEHAVAATRDFVEGRDQSLTVTLAPGAFRMVADATRLEQVVVNLLTNASKYTQCGGTITVDLARENGTKAVFRVKDNGRGIPVDMLVNVFDLFSQVAPTIDRKTGGLGLGLTLVKRLVGMHGGTVSAMSEGPGTGSEFIVTLPVEANDEAVPSRRPTSPPAVTARKRVLVIDDAEDVREMLESYLQHLGHDVHSA